jgi:HMG (high mobility group) box
MDKVNQITDMTAPVIMQSTDGDPLASFDWTESSDSPYDVGATENDQKVGSDYDVDQPRYEEKVASVPRSRYIYLAPKTSGQQGRENLEGNADEKHIPCNFSNSSSSSRDKKREWNDVLNDVPNTRRKKKAKSLPKRPLSAYNFYFQQIRSELIAKSGEKTGFHELGKYVGQKWKSLSESELQDYKLLANQDLERYRKEMDQHKKMEHIQMKSSFIASHNDHEYGVDDDDDLLKHSSFPRPPSIPSLAVKSGPSSSGNRGGLNSPAHNMSPGFTGQRESGTMMDSMTNILPPSGMRLSPGSQVYIRDSHGDYRPYTIQYTLVTMPREEAEQYWSS